VVRSVRLFLLLKSLCPHGPESPSRLLPVVPRLSPHTNSIPTTSSAKSTRRCHDAFLLRKRDEDSGLRDGSVFRVAHAAQSLRWLRTRELLPTPYNDHNGHDDLRRDSYPLRIGRGMTAYSRLSLRAAASGKVNVLQHDRLPHKIVCIAVPVSLPTSLVGDTVAELGKGWRTSTCFCPSLVPPGSYPRTRRTSKRP
jgi:hypothetical protein